MSEVSEFSRTVHRDFAEVDEVVLQYCTGFVEDAVEGYEQSADEAITFVTSLIVDAGGDASKVDALTKQLTGMFRTRDARKGSSDGDAKLERLDHTINMGAQNQVSSTLGLVGSKVDLDAVRGRKIESKVDKRKLQKAEAKIRAKWERRTLKADYESSKLIEPEKKSYEDFFMSVNPLQMESTAGKNKDIRVDNFDLSFGSKRILTDASLNLVFGRRFGLVGSNGVGKSTLLRAIARRELNIPNYITILHVEQEVTGDDTPALQAVLEADVWRTYLMNESERIQGRLAEIESELKELAASESADQAVARRLERERDDLDTQLTEITNRLSEMESDKAESRAASILAGLGFSHEAQQNATKTFSGGWRMRLSLARALFCNPDLLLLDEPSNMLDVPSIAFLSDYLQHKYQNTLLVVSHDRTFLDEVATDIIHQHSERLDLYRGNFTQFYATKEDRLQHQIREYEKQMEYRRHLQSFIDRFRYNAAKSSEAQSRIKKLEKLPVIEVPEKEQQVTFRFPEVEKISPPVLQMDDVSFGYSPDKPILRNVDIDVQLDSRIGVIGPNGAGKTTMLKLLIDKLTPLTGHVSKHPRLRIAYFAQHHVDGLDLSVSPLSFVSKVFPGLTEEEYRRHLGAFGISGPLALQKLGTLSGGQKSRVAFACLGLSKPHVLVMDEPTNHLDMQAMDALIEAIKAYGGGVILVSHDVSFLDAACTSLWLCEHGTVTKFPGSISQYKKRCLQEQDLGRQ